MNPDRTTPQLPAIAREIAHIAALSPAPALDAEGLALLRDVQSVLGDIVMGEGLHPDDAVTYHKRIDDYLAKQERQA